MLSAENLLPVFPQLAVEPDISVQRHRFDAEFPAKFRDRGIAVAIAAWARRTWALVRANLRPPLRPLMRAADSPAIVRSRINSLSNSASATKMPKTRRPDVIVVSICAPCPVRTRSPTPRPDNASTVLTRYARLRPSRSRRQAHLRSGERAGSSPARAVRPGHRTPGPHRSSAGRRSLHAGHRAADPGTGIHRISISGRSRSACFANARLGYGGFHGVSGLVFRFIYRFTITVSHTVEKRHDPSNRVLTRRPRSSPNRPIDTNRLHRWP